MTPYIDVGFLSTLLIKTPGRKSAWRNLHRFDPPYTLNLLHHLQIENLLVRCQLDPDDRIKITGLEGARLWQFYLREGVFPSRWSRVGRGYSRRDRLDQNPD